MDKTFLSSYAAYAQWLLETNSFQPGGGGVRVMAVDRAVDYLYPYRLVRFRIRSTNSYGIVDELAFALLQPHELS